MNETKLKEEMLQKMLARVPEDIDKREGSVIYNALAPAAEAIVEEILPGNPDQRWPLIYNRHMDLSEFRHRELARYNQDQIRNEVLTNGE